MTFDYTSGLCLKHLLRSTNMELFIEILSPRKERAISPRTSKLTLHRNFLYDANRKRGVLVDFGLAEVLLTIGLRLCYSKRRLTHNSVKEPIVLIASAERIMKLDATK